jgi:hypothetical protein
MKYRDKIMMLAAIIAFLVGIGLTVAGFCVPPVGVISGSVLTALGELLTFFASVFGIGKFTEVQIEKIKNSTKKGDSE